MKILLYSGGKKAVEKSGIGKAMEHQAYALESNQIDYTCETGEDYDIVHINTIFPDSYLMSKRAKKAGKKVIYYAHSTIEDFRNSFIGSNLVAPMFGRWIKKCYESGDLIITPTDYSRGLLKSYGIEKPIISLSNGIDLKKYKKSEEGRKRFREKYQLSEDKKVIISVGHYIERKGIVEFVELAKKMPEYTFMWFGHTNLNLVPDKVKEAVRTSLPNLIFTGYVDRESLMDAYSGSDLFLFLTHEETEGIVLLEAMAMEIPVLVRDIPIYKEWLPEGKAVYKGRTEEEFQKAILDMMAGNLPVLTDEAYEIVENNDISKIGERLGYIYEGLQNEVCVEAKRTRLVPREKLFNKKVMQNILFGRSL